MDPPSSYSESPTELALDDRNSPSRRPLPVRLTPRLTVVNKNGAATPRGLSRPTSKSAANPDKREQHPLPLKRNLFTSNQQRKSSNSSENISKNAFYGIFIIDYDGQYTYRNTRLYSVKLCPSSTREDPPRTTRRRKRSSLSIKPHEIFSYYHETP